MSANATPAPDAAPVPPAPPPPPRPPSPRSGWQRFTAGALALFHRYANWLVSISWKRFFVLAILLIIASEILQQVPPFNQPMMSFDPGVAPVVVPPLPPRPPRPGSKPDDTVRIEKKDSRDRDVTISIGRDGIRIMPGPAASASASAPPALPGASASASNPPPPSAASAASVEIRLPEGLGKEIAQEIRAAVAEAVREAEQEANEAAGEAAEVAAEAAAEATSANERVERAVRRARTARFGDFLTDLAWIIVLASAILKIAYKGTIQAETKAAEATETAESEQLKRQVVEARMAAMQAQVEPHFLFNTLASIDHLIQTDPPRASQMQRNLIALLRASMPSMRESHPTAHNLGREMAVVRPYVEILKVRMEDRLQAAIAVPNGLLSAEFPPMMVQSLVENAIKHGLEPKAEGGALSVSAEIIDGKLAVTVADTGLGFGKADTAGTGVGLANIRDRLKLLYGDRGSMVVADNVPAGTVVTIAVPYQAHPLPAQGLGTKS